MYTNILYMRIFVSALYLIQKKVITLKCISIDNATMDEMSVLGLYYRH